MENIWSILFIFWVNLFFKVQWKENGSFFIIQPVLFILIFVNFFLSGKLSNAVVNLRNFHKSSSIKETLREFWNKNSIFNSFGPSKRNFIFNFIIKYFFQKEKKIFYCIYSNTGWIYGFIIAFIYHYVFNNGIKSIYSLREILVLFPSFKRR